MYIMQGKQMKNQPFSGQKNGWNHTIWKAGLVFLSDMQYQMEMVAEIRLFHMCRKSNDCV